MRLARTVSRVMRPVWALAVVAGLSGSLWAATEPWEFPGGPRDADREHKAVGGGYSYEIYLGAVKDLRLRRLMTVITSYSIHYTKLYDKHTSRKSCPALDSDPGGVCAGQRSRRYWPCEESPEAGW